METAHFAEELLCVSFADEEDEGADTGEGFGPGVGAGVYGCDGLDIAAEDWEGVDGGDI